MDLSQYPKGSIGTLDDPLSDPYDDASYDFSFRTIEHERREEADSTGQVRGLYSYLDDIGERHTVRYAARAETGFEVLNSVPDTPTNVAFNAPLYKASSDTRGKMSVQRGPDGQYKFLVTSPDQRRSETSGPDGIVRGLYSYLDDKGVQRTVRYIAGDGIGFRVVQNIVGRETHLRSPSFPPVPSYGTRVFSSNDLLDGGFLRTAESGRIRSKDESSQIDQDSFEREKSFKGRLPSSSSSFSTRDDDLNSSRGDSSNESSLNGFRKTNFFRNRSRLYQNRRNFDGDLYKYEKPSVRKFENVNSLDSNNPIHPLRPIKPTRPTQTSLFNGGESTKSERPSTSLLSKSSLREQSRLSDDQYANSFDYGKDLTVQNGNSFGKHFNKHNFNGRRPSTTLDEPYRDQGRFSPATNRKSFEYGKDSNFPLASRDRNRLQSDREYDWSVNNHDSTLIKNVGKWYFGLPPGSAVRAHVQNIDLLPLGSRSITPSEALRRDEIEAKV